MSRVRPADATVTPDAVRLRVDAAGLGSRMIALLLDFLIQMVLLIPLLLAFALDGVAGVGEAVALSIVVFAVLWLYFPLFESLWGGQTPGKRAQRIRVVRTDGQPAGFAPVLVRNLVRIVDVILLPFIAVISMFVTERAQRLGDLAAGTLVIRDRPMPVPYAVDLPHGDAAHIDVDASGVNEAEYALIRSFLVRRDRLDAAAREKLAASLVAALRERSGVNYAPGTLGDEHLLEAVARAYRARFTDTERGPLA